ncbi:hypothetical protein HK099_001620 [Clydaea vesicula]|uniref:WD40 repeat-like protein n=1 Tax=Clydaea vesicula TaxID=447962 RepID=A0AAD5U4Y5_9FUNG|nr:hypothetical protein HK099_001620 [Clydaea vesicula]
MESSKKSQITSDTYLRDQLDKTYKEAKANKLKSDLLEKENIALKKSLYDLSVRYNVLANKIFLNQQTKQQNLLNFTIFEPIETSENSLHLSNSINHSVSQSNKDSSTELNGNNSSLLTAEISSSIVVSNSSNTSNQESTIIDDGVPRNEKKLGKNGKYFTLKHDLKGHTGAVYAVKFSKCTKFIASGSFDKTVRVWDTISQKELISLKKHNLNVSDLDWSIDSKSILSGGYDQTCKTWSIDPGKLVENYDTDGFVQCVQFDPNSNDKFFSLLNFLDDQIFFCGTTRNALGIFDRRKSAIAYTIKNDSMVNSILVYNDGNYVLSGDDEARYVGVNSYDNVMRIYDRGFLHPNSIYRVTNTLKGYKNKNWPIKSSFFYSTEGLKIKRSGSHDDIFSKTNLDLEFEMDNTDSKNFSKSEKNQGCMLVATGSADPFVYIYQDNEILQKIEGHTDRVYSVSFHPTEPILLSCSADSTVKMWSYKKYS